VVSTTTPAPEGQNAQADSPSQARGTRFVEAVLDNLSAWTVIAAAIAFLYLVWATIEILGRYLEGLPSVTP